MTKDAEKDGRPKPARKVPRKVTKDRLRNIALHYLERYATSAQNLKRALERRVIKAARHHDTDMALARSWIDEVVDTLVRADAIDDSRYADGKTITMLLRGQSPAKVRAYLASKGVGKDTITAALDAARDTLGNPDLEAALAYAIRRRFGPFRTSEDTREIRDKELAAMGRAGFRYEIARKIVDATEETELA